MSHGVRIFRVDNPHTKPVAFWEWLLGEIRKTDPDVLFLAEAFTRPAMMHDARQGRLPPVATPTSPGATRSGSSRSTCTSCRTETGHFMRPNFFVNTPDILHAYLQYGGPAGVQDPRRAGGDLLADLGRVLRVRAVRARRRAAGQRGVPDSEKFQCAPRDWAVRVRRRLRSLAPGSGCSRSGSQGQVPGARLRHLRLRGRPVARAVLVLLRVQVLLAARRHGTCSNSS